MLPHKIQAMTSKGQGGGWFLHDGCRFPSKLHLLISTLYVPLHLPCNCYKPRWCQESGAISSPKMDAWCNFVEPLIASAKFSNLSHLIGKILLVLYYALQMSSNPSIAMHLSLKLACSKLGGRFHQMCSMQDAMCNMIICSHVNFNTFL